MTQPDHIITPQGRRIAYHRTPAGPGVTAPGILFLGGFRSDMEGTKALYLQDWAQANGRAFVRFDYSGHGVSDGRFLDGCIGDWADDARAVLDVLTTGPQVLVGSSMGGWIALLLARAIPRAVSGVVGIAAAPDFTEDNMWANATPTQRTRLMADGQIETPTEYSSDPYIITRRLIEDGRNHLVLRHSLHLPMPVRLLQGTADVDVPPTVALRLLEHATGPDIRLTLVKGADHRFSTPDCLALIGQTVASLATGGGSDG